MTSHLTVPVILDWVYNYDSRWNENSVFLWSIVSHTNKYVVGTFLHTQV